MTPNHAEGDGKTDCSEQQDRPERNAIPGVLYSGPHRKGCLHRAGRSSCRLGDSQRRIRACAGEQVERVLVAKPF